MSYPPQQPGSWPDPYWSGDPNFSVPPQQQGYVDPAYGGYGQPAVQPMVVVPARSTNGLAIASLVLALAGLITCGVTSIVGAIMGSAARKQIKARNEDGDGLALAGIIAGWIIFGLYVVFGILMGLYFYFVYKAIVDYQPDPYPYST